MHPAVIIVIAPVQTTVHSIDPFDRIFFILPVRSTRHHIRIWLIEVSLTRNGKKHDNSEYYCQSFHCTFIFSVLLIYKPNAIPKDIIRLGGQPPTSTPGSRFALAPTTSGSSPE